MKFSSINSASLNIYSNFTFQKFIVCGNLPFFLFSMNLTVISSYFDKIVDFSVAHYSFDRWAISKLNKQFNQHIANIENFHRKYLMSTVTNYPRYGVIYMINNYHYSIINSKIREEITYKFHEFIENKKNGKFPQTINFWKVKLL